MNELLNVILNNEIIIGGLVIPMVTALWNAFSKNRAAAVDCKTELRALQTENRLIKDQLAFFIQLSEVTNVKRNNGRPS